MQAAATAVSFSVLPVKGTPKKSLAPRRMARFPAGRTQTGRTGAVAAVASETAEIDYSSSVSVFPMEACDLIGGEACNAQMFPESKLEGQSAGSASSAATEEIERDYLSYDEPKTVFPGEACDDLGGEFCEAPYQTGVSKDLVSA